MQGKVIKIFSDFYYVKTDKGVIECKLREVLKKSGISVVVGDNVLIDNLQQNSEQAYISQLMQRKNSLIRPSVSNIDLIVLVISLKHPKTPLTNIDRYLAQAKFFGLDAVICANKSDLSNTKEQENIVNIYRPLGYDIVFTSALEKTGISELKEYLNNKTSLFCGASGVGKSSLCNAINKDVLLKTGEVSKNFRGTHTTRHCEILSVEDGNNNFEIVDTPGFSLLKFDYVEPQRVKDFFPEISQFAKECKFSDCLHENEQGCNVIEHISEIASSRYQSYLDMLNEAKEYKKRIQNQGIKIETKLKTINEKFVPKISAKKRDFSRKKAKQLLKIEADDE